MGRLWNKIKQGAKKVGRFIGRVAGKVGDVAGVLSNIPVIGGIASTVAKGANLVSKIGNGAANLMEKAETKARPFADKLKEAAKEGKGLAARIGGDPSLPPHLRKAGGAVSRVINRGQEIRDRMERRYDAVAGQAQRIGQRIEAGVNKAGGIARQVVQK